MSRQLRKIAWVGLLLIATFVLATTASAAQPDDALYLPLISGSVVTTGLRAPVSSAFENAPSRQVLLPVVTSSGVPDEASLFSAATPGWTVIVAESFEGFEENFPGLLWEVKDDDGAKNGEYRWDEDDYRAHSGSRSAWPARGGINGLDPETNNYPTSLNSWMNYGPFDLRDASLAQLRFWVWMQSNDSQDQLCWYASSDRADWRLGGCEFDTRDVMDKVHWVSKTFDLGTIPGLVGNSSVWIRFRFVSDSDANVNTGPLVDDIVLEKKISDRTCPVGQYLAEYFSNTSLSITSDPYKTLCDPAPLSHDWGTAGPIFSPSVHWTDNFSVRWRGTFSFAAGEYEFVAKSDDGMKVWLDDTLIVDRWNDQGATPFSSTQSVSQGEHQVLVQYYEHGGSALADFRWVAVCPIITAWKGEYYNNQNRSGDRVVCRNDVGVDGPGLDFNWGLGSPAAGVLADHFSARWTRRINFAAGTYRFYMKGDDGFRLFLDDNSTPIINGYIDQMATDPPYKSNPVVMTAGAHRLQVAFYENTTFASVKLWWELVP